MTTTAIPADLEEACREAWSLARDVEGGVTEREVHLLAAAMACAPAAGATIEIGSFKGRSTVALGAVARRYGRAPVIAVDPHTGPSVTDPPLGAARSSYEEFIANLERAGVRDQVQVHRAFSRELASGWSGPIRFLWIDGDHTYTGALEDWQLFSPHLSPGAIIAMHDVLHGYEGPIRVFVEELLASPQIIAAGVVGSIGWAQFRPGRHDSREAATAKHRLARRARPLVPYTQRGAPLRGLAKLTYRLRRSRVPHGAVNVREWARLVTSNGPARPS
jgi:predicted O-methyltransferase YrrM